ncbi:sortase B family protein [Butyrivibrio proteoclasticus B316]|uniref:Sortase B family protein n=1 Tax=Butyrivibrio proteoclasticus (strain ATCC 51982 / DSM 14932 / B316) TaxID=515622 RepID=E0RXL9_BUTPB|nr:class B sortase [Butyrivibrio proteoclasticus]ADL34446.1 sortase B family protein [Butyrivibrio proteoclasticus B316]
MQNLLSNFKEFNNKHKKLVPFIIYFEIIAVILASAFKYIRKNIKLVALIILIVAIIILTIRYLTGSGNTNAGSAGTEIVETVSVDEVIAARSASGSVDEASVIGMSEEAASSEDTDAAEEADDTASESVEAVDGELSVDITATEANEEVNTSEEASDLQSSENTYAANDASNEDTSDLVQNDNEATDSAEGGKTARPVATLPKEGISKFIAVYPETIAWIWFEDDRLNYPIMQSEDNTKYMIKDFQGNDSDTGSLFLDYRASADFTDSNSIIYGHNMRDRTMFGALRTYKDDLGFLENHKYFQIITPEGRTRYMIFAFMDVPKNSYIYDVVGADPDNMREFLDTIEYKTYIDTGIEPTVDDKIITLSTCTRSDTLFFVMFAVEVE